MAPKADSRQPYVEWAQLEIRPVLERIGFNYAPAGLHLTREWFLSTIPGYDLWFVSAGKGVLETGDDRKIDLRRGVSILFSPDYRDYQLKHTPDTERLGVYWFHFGIYEKSSPTPLSPASGLMPRLPHHLEIVEINFFETCLKKIVALARDTRSQDKSRQDAIRQQVALICQNLLIEYESSFHLQLFSKQHGLQLQHQRIVSEFMGRLYESPGTIQSVEILAREYGYSADYFSHIIKTATGMKLKQLIIDARMEQAKRLLLSEDDKLENIAASLGYSDLFYFLRQFKKQTGMTPSEFRHEASGEAFRSRSGI